MIKHTLTVGHCFFSYLNSNLSKKFNDCNNFDELIDVCVENVFEFHAVIKLVHGSRSCDLENCQVTFQIALGSFVEK